jgi:hypothetical protein
MDPSTSPPTFHIGDRVQLISRLDSLAVGSIGTVRIRFLGSSLYDVQFDNPSGLRRLVDRRKLALVPHEPSGHW